MFIFLLLIIPLSCNLSLLLLLLSSLQYDIMGHSGDGYDIELVRADNVPKNNKQRLKVLKVQIYSKCISVNNTGSANAATEQIDSEMASLMKPHCHRFHVVT